MLILPSVLFGLGVSLVALGGLAQSRRSRRRMPSLLYSQPLPDLSRSASWYVDG